MPMSKEFCSQQKVRIYYEGKSKPATRGVLFRDSEGNLHRAYLKSRKSEVIIMAGALGSPQILLLSGIGPEQHLKSLNISVVLNQPNVGQDMKDNPMNLVFLESPFPVEASLVGVVGVTRSGSYIEATVGTQLNDLFARITDDQRSRQGVFMEKFDGPASTGHLELRNTDPTDNPMVTFNYFQDPDDLRRCVVGMGETIEVIESRAFSRFRLPNLTVTDLLNNVQNTPLNFVPNRSNNYTSLDQFCRDNVLSIFHYHGGCRVGRVVDEDYKVIGVKSLRVVDGSTFDGSPGTNPQATLLMLGRYMGVMIQRERTGNH
ncbi:hypothetical protein Leryth_008901 [Lithospermum erythrorhizon]|nr:hypothetical protein Leryth_008901 [Lithospermum erythrorhizon]